MPSLSSFLPTRIPGNLLDHESGNAAVPGRRINGREQNKDPASFALVIHSLRPFRTYSSPFVRARVCSANASEPEPASLNA